MFEVFTQEVIAQPNTEEVGPVNPNVGMEASIVNDFTRMNPLEFDGCKIEKVPQDFIEEVYVICYYRSDSDKEGGIGRLPTPGCCSYLVRSMKRGKVDGSRSHKMVPSRDYRGQDT